MERERESWLPLEIESRGNKKRRVEKQQTPTYSLCKTPFHVVSWVLST
jgi:hypothetical protein